MHPEPPRPPPDQEQHPTNQKNKKRGLNMIYTKTFDENGTAYAFPMLDMEIYCRCPRCGKEIEISADYWDFVSSDSNFDPFDSAIYCDNCILDMQEMKEYITEHISASLDHAPSEELAKLLEFTQKYANI